MIELQENDLLFAKVRQDAIIPTKDNENAGYDIYANFEEDYLIIPPHETVLVPTGIASALSDKYYLQVHERGSTGSKGMKYGAGVIDSSFRGEIFIVITNTNNSEIVISKLSCEELLSKYGKEDEDGDTCIEYAYKNEKLRLYFDNVIGECYRAIIYPYSKAIAQLIVHEVPKMNVKEVPYEELKNIPSKRGTGALGSSKK